MCSRYGRVVARTQQARTNRRTSPREAAARSCSHISQGKLVPTHARSILPTSDPPTQSSNAAPAHSGVRMSTVAVKPPICADMGGGLPHTSAVAESSGPEVDFDGWG
jgi:hypothetical protein